MPIRLLPERELCAIHDVSRITISKALDLLEAEGLVQRTPGRGTLTIPEAIDRWKRLRQSRVIHVLMGWENLAAAPSSYYGQIYQGIFSRSEMAGYRVSLQQIRSHRTDAIADPDLPDPRTTLGVIFVGLMNEPTIALCTQADYPVVCVDYWTTNPQADAVVVDCYSEGQEAIELLVSRGHRSLFYLGNTFTIRGPLEKESDAMLLLSGMQRGLDMARLPMLPSGRIRFCGTAPEDALQAATWISSLRPRPTGWLRVQRPGLRAAHRRPERSRPALPGGYLADHQALARPAQRDHLPALRGAQPGRTGCRCPAGSGRRPAIYRPTPRGAQLPGSRPDRPAGQPSQTIARIPAVQAAGFRDSKSAGPQFWRRPGLLGLPPQANRRKKQWSSGHDSCYTAGCEHTS